MTNGEREELLRLNVVDFSSLPSSLAKSIALSKCSTFRTKAFVHHLAVFAIMRQALTSDARRANDTGTDRKPKSIHQSTAIHHDARCETDAVLRRPTGTNTYHQHCCSENRACTTRFGEINLQTTLLLGNASLQQCELKNTLCVSYDTVALRRERGARRHERFLRTIVVPIRRARPSGSTPTVW